VSLELVGSSSCTMVGQYEVEHISSKSCDSKTLTLLKKLNSIPLNYVIKIYS